MSCAQHTCIVYTIHRSFGERKINTKSLRTSLEIFFFLFFKSDRAKGEREGRGSLGEGKKAFAYTLCVKKKYIYIPTHTTHVYQRAYTRLSE